MFFRQILHEETACVSYCVGCTSIGVVAIIDPQIEIQQYLDVAKRFGLKIAHIIDTHVQADHLSGVQLLAKATKAPIYYHAQAPVAFAHQKLQEGDLLKVGNRQIKFIHTPGHTDDSMSLLVDDWFLLTGDTLFVGDVGRVDLSLDDSDEAEINRKAGDLYDSLFGKLLNLPDYVEIYPAHYAGSACGKHMDGKPASTIGREKRFNHALQLQSRDEFVEMMVRNLPPPPANYRQIKMENLRAV